MSQSPTPALGQGFQPFQPPPYGMQVPRPLSGAAVTAFVASLLVCCPVIHVLVGLICGFLGIANTSRGQARGRILAILAIPISVLFGIGEGLLGYAYYRAIKEVMMLPIESARIFQTTPDGLDDSAGMFYDRWASDDLKADVSRSRFQAWARAVQAKTGQLVEASLEGTQPGSGTPNPTSSQAIFTMNLRARFVNGNFVVVTDVLMIPANFPDMFKVDDLTIADLGVRQMPEESPTAPPAGEP